ncbi:FG-nucleoporin nsp1 [Emydomyces testavorans]|uniref:Nucleoporin NSP1 n=1 Tax=Emydomyces testavorans TaxID=2070801 RepID=A0AAF0DK61_9EURO|nr:FG-nucleoporin nsp1 [Emydomyces testavorans]
MSNPFQFGTPATTSGASTTPTSSAVFGQNTSGSSGGGGIFGNVGSEQKTSSGSQSLFGTAAPAQSTSLFGQGTSTTPGFAFKSTDQKQSPTPSAFGEIGKTSSAATPFGSTTPAPMTGGLFGNLSTTPAGPPPSSTSAGQPSSLFGQTAQPTGGSSALFGAKPTAPSTTESITPAATTSGPLFGATKATTGPTFGAASGFGGLGGEKQAGAAQMGKEDGKPSLFGTPTSTATISQAPGSLFAAPSTSAEKPTSSPFSFPPPATSATTPATATSAGGSMFGGLGAKTSTPNESAAATTTQAPTSSMFSLLKPAETTSATPTLGIPATTPAPKTTTTAGATISAPTTTTAAAPATTAAGISTLGASTAGPAPPAQSRLKNKTMDEIITRWATDLTKYQKEFQEQAEQVAEWDRMLVENATKVQKLYGNTIDAERATQEVERQLAAVEGQQDELSSWLDRYEQEVEALLSKQVGAGDSLQGPDQERERTYKLAERLSERLNDMGQDLTSMIEEVNSASANLSKTTKADEPISQIVRILNSHLSQLQLIDQGTTALRAKIAANQKAGSSLGGLQSQYGGYRSGTPGSLSGGAAEDFYRAYMGRR